MAMAQQQNNFADFQLHQAKQRMEQMSAWRQLHLQQWVTAKNQNQSIEAPLLSSTPEETIQQDALSGLTSNFQLEQDSSEIELVGNVSKRPRLETRASTGCITNPSEFKTKTTARVLDRRSSTGCTDPESKSSNEWHSSSDLPHRIEITQRIMKLLTDRKTNPSEKWLQELPHKARRLEQQLYKSASSLEAYTDLKSLKYRLKKVATAITFQVRLSKSKAKRPPSPKEDSSICSQNTLETKLQEQTPLTKPESTKSDAISTCQNNPAMVDVSQQQQLLLLLMQQQQQLNNLVQMGAENSSASNLLQQQQQQLINTLSMLNQLSQANQQTALPSGTSTGQQQQWNTNNTLSPNPAIMQSSDNNFHSSTTTQPNQLTDDVDIQFLRETFGFNDVFSSMT